VAWRGAWQGEGTNGAEREAELQKYKVTLTERTPMLMHADNIDWADEMELWKNNPKNKGASKAGDDRTPAWRWIGCLNSDDPANGVVTIPSEYVMRSIMGGASQVLMKGKTTFKALSQSGIICEDFHWPLMVHKKPVKMGDIQVLRDFESFREHTEAVRELGFSLFVKRAAVGSSKHIRVRPRFDDWSSVGTLLVIEKQITREVLMQMLDIAGRTKGLGDWRPGGKTPGPWGTYEADVQAI
jgi:hypothetical protein